MAEGAFTQSCCTLAAVAFAETTLYPMDSIKIWHQTTAHSHNGGFVSLVRRGVQTGGLSGLYGGAPFGVFRSSVGSAAMMALKRPMQRAMERVLRVKMAAQGDRLSPSQLAVQCSATAQSSMICSYALTPFETLKTRLQADGRKWAPLRRYGGHVDCVRTFVHNNGVKALWTGAWATAVRAALWWSASVPAYAAAKNRLMLDVGMADNIYCHFSASAIAGFVACAASMPVDVAKTKIANQTLHPEPEYRSMVHCLVKTARTEGPLALGRGFWTRYARVGPWQVLFYCCYEHLWSLCGGDGDASL